MTGLLLITVVILFALGSSRAGTEPVPREETAATIPATNVSADALEAKLNVIFEFDDENKKTGHVLVEVLSPKGERLSYIAFPEDARYFMTGALYEELSSELITVPQMITFSELYEYYGKKTAFAAGAKIVAEMCGAASAYYTVADTEVFSELFDVKDGYGAASVSLKKYPSDLRAEGVKTLDFVTTMVGKVKTSWSLADRLVYLELLEGLDDSDILFFDVSGETTSGGTLIDTDKLKSIILEVR